MHRWRLRAIVAATLLAATSGAMLNHERLLPRVARWLDVGEPPRACDYVFVLPGGEATRPFVAAAIVKRGLAQEVLVPRTADTPSTLDGTSKPTHEIDRAVLEHRGVPPGAVRLIGQESTSTYTDALALAAFLESRPTARVAIVTNDYHTRRARWIFRNVMGSRSGNFYFVSAPNDRFDATMWWRCREGAWANLSEYAKLTTYVFKHGGWQFWGSGILLAAVIAASLWTRRRLGKMSEAIVKRSESTSSRFAPPSGRETYPPSPNLSPWERNPFPLT